MFGLWEVRTNRLRGGPTCVIYTVFVVHFVFTVEQQRAVTTLSPWAVGRRVWKEKVGMKSLREYLTFETNRRREYINITSQVQELVRRSGIKEGLCLGNAMHISASVYINDDEGGLIKDYDDWLEKLAPHEPRFAVSAQPYWRGQRGRSSETSDNGTGSHGGCERWGT